MKTERRHDLETNELARRATVWIDKVKPYSSQIVGVIVVLLGLWVVSSVWGSLSASQDEAAWDAYDLAITSNDVEMTNMQRVANDELYEGSNMQEWAFAAWADRQLFIASKQYLADRNAAEERLTRVTGVYEQLAENAGEDQLRNRARFGLARVYELQNKLEEAGREYDQVRGDLEPLARAYADRLLTPEAKEAYAWLSTAELPRRSAGIPGGRPNFDAILPDATDPTGLNVQTLENILNLGDEKPADDRYDAKAPPKEESEKSAAPAGSGDDIFRDESPADESVEDQPADDQPAAEVPADDAKQP